MSWWSSGISERYSVLLEQEVTAMPCQMCYNVMERGKATVVSEVSHKQLEEQMRPTAALTCIHTAFSKGNAKLQALEPAEVIYLLNDVNDAPKQ